MLALSERSVAVTAAQHTALQPSPKSEFDSAVVKLASFTIHNRSSTHQSFALLGSNPEVVSANGASGGTLRHGVYQASRIVAAKTGSYTFMLPAASPLAWASPLGEHPDVIVVTGRAREAPKDGTKLFISDYALLATKDTERRSCEMTMPVGSEPRFKTEKELGTWGGKSREGMEDGIIDIHVDNTFITHHPGSSDPVQGRLVISGIGVVLLQGEAGADWLVLLAVGEVDHKDLLSMSDATRRVESSTFY
ncbi:hypothetical protein HG530_014628 [Fusarium avenaceum]|nr:hypothetical protein HG530_014628 [Fusarium avenaceum]